MKVYLIARYGRRKDMVQVATDLEAMDHTVVSTWIEQDRELEDRQPTSKQAIRWAFADLAKLDRSDCAIAFTESPGEEIPGATRGGRHYEACRAAFTLSWRWRRLILVGPRENIFYHLPGWEHYPDWATCRAALTGEG